MRGAHKDVEYSKGTSLMEAERFAAQIKRPAPNGRALLCAADNAREIQGSYASHKRNDARNRAPVTPVSLRDRRESQCKGKVGESRGAGKPWCPCPFCSRRWEPAIPPPGDPASPPPDGGNPPPPVRTGVSAAEGGNFSESFIKALPEQRPCAPATESASRSFAAQFLLRVPVRRSTAPPCARW